jgi:FlaA1/EpsC-like NDP-sugar epimerase
MMTAMPATMDERLSAFFHEKTVLITGATGTLGQALTQMIIQFDPKSIRLFSRDEYKQYLLYKELGENSKYRFLIGDVRDLDRVLRATEGADIVIHTAALKHVTACEYNPFEAVKTNVIGTQNMITACLQNNVKYMLLTSSDKAISPLNTMGATKLLAERLMTSMAYAKGQSSTTFCTVRFGNVLGSRGSAINRFIEEIKKDKPLKVTDLGMTRFMMSVNQAVSLVLKALLLSKGGDVFVLKMPVVKLGDLIQVLFEAFTDSSETKNKIQIIGPRSGEKMYEELLSEEEAKIALELDDMFVLPPQWKKDHHYASAQPAAKGSHCSKDIPPISINQIKTLLLDAGIILNP